MSTRAGGRVTIPCLAATMTLPIRDPQRLETITPAEPTGGTPLGSRYVLDHPIGQGAMGKVWRGRRREDGRPVAIKVLRADYLAEPDVVTRFMRERTALRQL